jgi:hypothetical protein
MSNQAKKKKFGRLVVLLIIALIGLVGLIGSFNNSPVNITSFSEFVKSYATIFVPFAIVIAAGGESKRLINMKYGENKSIDVKPE